MPCHHVVWELAGYILPPYVLHGLLGDEERMNRSVWLAFSYLVRHLSEMVTTAVISVGLYASDMLCVYTQYLPYMCVHLYTYHRYLSGLIPGAVTRSFNT